MVEERALERWFALEMGRFQSSFVPAARPLHELLLEAEPTARTRSGEVHRFEPSVLRQIHDALGPLDRRRLRLPITFYVDRELSNEAYMQDEPAIALLRGLGEIAPDAQPREGKLWMGRSRAMAISARFAGVFQFVYF